MTNSAIRLRVTGAGGLLGREVAAAGGRRGWVVEALGRTELDVLDGEAVKRAIKGFSPHIVFHSAAYTDVDGAESEPELAMALNAVSAGTVASASAASAALMIYPSTDYVFSGQSNSAYMPGDSVSPLGAYARSKAAGEEAVQALGDRVLVVRTSWLYGSGRDDFVDAILAAASLPNPGPLAVVEDQIGAPTLARGLSEAMLDLAKTGTLGLYHLADTGEVSRAEWARTILRIAGVRRDVLGITTESRGDPARRPLNSRLDCSTGLVALGKQMPHWESNLREYMSAAGLTRAAGRRVEE